MRMKTGKGFADPAVVTKQMREDSRLLKLATFNDLLLANTLVITKHPEDGPGIAEMDKTTTRLITF